MALAALLIGTVAGIAAFALTLALGQSVLVALLVWWAVGTGLTLLPLAVIALAPEAGDLAEDIATA